ncbi:MAG: hypothetical protein JKY54_17515 [Flavobacteriales bacterium]|nr:hypothetical protein [Flavobacteriales bacterium]
MYRNNKQQANKDSSGRTRGHSSRPRFWNLEGARGVLLSVTDENIVEWTTDVSVMLDSHFLRETTSCMRSEDGSYELPELELATADGIREALDRTRDARTRGAAAAATEPDDEVNAILRQLTVDRLKLEQKAALETSHKSVQERPKMFAKMLLTMDSDARMDLEKRDAVEWRALTIAACPSMLMKFLLKHFWLSGTKSEEDLKCGMMRRFWTLKQDGRSWNEYHLNFLNLMKQFKIFGIPEPDNSIKVDAIKNGVRPPFDRAVQDLDTAVRSKEKERPATVSAMFDWLELNCPEGSVAQRRAVVDATAVFSATEQAQSVDQAQQDGPVHQHATSTNGNGGSSRGTQGPRNSWRGQRPGNGGQLGQQQPRAAPRQQQQNQQHPNRQQQNQHRGDAPPVWQSRDQQNNRNRPREQNDRGRRQESEYSAKDRRLIDKAKAQHGVFPVYEDDAAQDDDHYAGDFAELDAQYSFSLWEGLDQREEYDSAEDDAPEKTNDAESEPEVDYHDEDSVGWELITNLRTKRRRQTQHTDTAATNDIVLVVPASDECSNEPAGTDQSGTQGHNPLMTETMRTSRLAGLDSMDVIADCGSMVNVVHNKKLLMDMHQLDKPRRLIGVGGGVVEVDCAGFMAPVGLTLYNPNSGVNILSWSWACSHPGLYAYFDPDSNEFVVETKAGRRWVFKQRGGLYVCRFDEAQTDGGVVAAATRVTDLESAYSKREVDEARAADKLHRNMGLPSETDFRAMISHGIPDSGVTTAHWERARVLYGPNLATIKGKTVRSRSAVIPAHISPRMAVSALTIYYDLFFIDGEIFLLGVSKPLNLRMISHLANKRGATIMAAISMQHSVYRAQQFQPRRIVFDGEGSIGTITEEIQNSGVQVERVAKGSHVSPAERCGRVLLERYRGIKCTTVIPFVKRAPFNFAMYLAYFVVSRLNMTPNNANGDSASPFENFTGRKPTVAKDLQLCIFDYCQVHVPNEITNTSAQRTQPAIALVPKGNLEGAWLFLLLGSMRVVARSKWTLYDQVPQVVIDFAQRVANRETDGVTRDADGVENPANWSRADRAGSRPEGKERPEPAITMHVPPVPEDSSRLRGSPRKRA